MKIIRYSGMDRKPALVYLEKGDDAREIDGILPDLAGHLGVVDTPWIYTRVRNQFSGEPMCTAIPMDQDTLNKMKEIFA